VKRATPNRGKVYTSPLVEDSPAVAVSPAMAHLLATLPELHFRIKVLQALQCDYDALFEKAQRSVDEANDRVVAAANAAGVECWRVGERVYTLATDQGGFALEHGRRVKFTDCQAAAPGGAA
jgi:hypothetical protein